ncbi:MAG: DNA cytosine methyltransferase [Myxococcales bacterium]|nr:DNA cytosine methyltransferase [Myxococcales bacterium]
MSDALVIDSFAGGGGASSGLEDALGHPVSYAINHSKEAVAMHEANHPNTEHFCQDIWEVSPREVCGSRRVKCMWASPDCTEFSIAKGGKPKSKKVRALANVVIDWAREVKPDVFYLENVQEFADWGPLDEDDKPIKSRKGEDFRAWVGALIELGYRVEWRLLVAADYGAPTSRKRLFLVARRDGRPIVWPEPTHGPRRTQPWRTAAEIIDWRIPCPSIFNRKRPLADATLRRIAAGLRRFVMESGRPFVVPLTHQGGDSALLSPHLTKFYGKSTGADLFDPSPTASTQAHLGLVMPYMRSVRTHGGGGNGPRSVEDPKRTILCSKRGEFAVVAPTLIQTGYGERPGQAPRVPGLGKPLGTAVASGQKHALVSFIAKHYGGVVGHGMDKSLGAITSIDHHSLVEASLFPIEGVDRRENVRAFLVKYYSSSGQVESQQQTLFEPVHTIPTKARFGLVTLGGVDYEITDIGMRMLDPRELFDGQGFRSDYKLEVELNGKRLTKTSLIELAGNSVCPPNARAVVAANRPAD